MVSDTSPLISLATVGLLHLLQALYGDIVVPSAVRDEYEAGRRTTEPILGDLNWIKTMPVNPDSSIPVMLDPGESAAIALALEQDARLILLDERIGRNVAVQLGLPVSGTLAVLLRAKREGLIREVRPLIDGMIEQRIRISPALRSRVLGQADEPVSSNP